MIRGYTNKQGELHWERQFTESQDPNVVGEIQDASNEIARKIFDDFIDSNWTLNNMVQLANQDATGIGETLFDFTSLTLPDTINSALPNGHNAAWAGTLLFSSFDNPSDPTLRVDQTYRLIGGDLNTAVVDNLDDWRNVLYANHSFGYVFTESRC